MLDNSVEIAKVISMDSDTWRVSASKSGSSQQQQTQNNLLRTINEKIAEQETQAGEFPQLRDRKTFNSQIQQFSDSK